MTPRVGLGSRCVAPLVTVYQSKKGVRSVTLTVSTTRTE